MTLVSSASSKPFRRVAPLASADNSKTRLEILLEPGRATVPSALTKGPISINSCTAELINDRPTFDALHLRV
jgi:hypothetical protein